MFLVDLHEDSSARYLTWLHHPLPRSIKNVAAKEMLYDGFLFLAPCPFCLSPTLPDVPPTQPSSPAQHFSRPPHCHLSLLTTAVAHELGTVYVWLGSFSQVTAPLDATLMYLYWMTWPACRLRVAHHSGLAEV